MQFPSRAKRQASKFRFFRPKIRRRPDQIHKLQNPSPKAKDLKNQHISLWNYSFEAIEESSCEEVTKHKPRTKTIHKSQHTSPRLLIDGALSAKRKSEKAKMQLKPTKGMQKSPYALHLSPSRLPAIKQGDRTIRAVRSFGNLKLRKNLD